MNGFRIQYRIITFLINHIKSIIYKKIYNLSLSMRQISETDSSYQSFEPNLEQKFFRANNGVTIICSSAEFNESGEIDGVVYTKRNKQDITIENAATTCTSGAMIFLMFSTPKATLTKIFRTGMYLVYMT